MIIIYNMNNNLIYNETYEYNKSLIDNMDFSNNVLYFIHIPKTGGTAFKSKSIIKSKEECHIFIGRKIYRLPYSDGGYIWKTDNFPLFNYPIKNHYKISIIRNPFDLLCSYYHHGSKLSLNDKWCDCGWASVNYTHKFSSFKQFICAYCNPKFKWHIPEFQKCLFSQLFDEKSNCVIDIIIKYEYYNEACLILNTKLKHKINNTKYNISVNKTKNYKEYYDIEMINLVNNKCKFELENFHYNFNGSTKLEYFIIKPNIKLPIN